MRILIIFILFIFSCSKQENFDERSEYLLTEQYVHPQKKSIEELIYVSFPDSLSIEDHLCYFGNTQIKDNPCFQDVTTDYFDLVRLENEPSIRQAYFSYQNCAYMAYLHDEIGLVYFVEINFYRYKKYALMHKPKFEDRIIERIVFKCDSIYSLGYESIRKGLIYSDEFP